MSYGLIFTDSYKKRAQRFARQHPELKEQYRKTLLFAGSQSQPPITATAPAKRQAGSFAFGIDQYQLSNNPGNDYH